MPTTVFILWVFSAVRLAVIADAGAKLDICWISPTILLPDGVHSIQHESTESCRHHGSGSNGLRHVDHACYRRWPQEFGATTACRSCFDRIGELQRIELKCRIRNIGR
jgi:hypothetical protein